MAMRLMIDRYNYFELGTEPFKVLFFFVILFFIILINNTPDINPPIWAAYATPPEFKSVPLKLINWIIIHPPRTIKALIFIIFTKIINQKKTFIFALGYKTKYPPSTPAIAPEAPIIGTVDVGSIKAWEKAATIPVTR